MREKRFIKGSTSDEKFKSLETTLRHFSRRLSHKVVGLVPATPIIRFVVPGEDGVILNMICPAKGKITQGCVYVESGEKSVPLCLQLKRGGKTEGNAYDIKANVPMPFRFDTEVELGDMITLWIDEPEVDGARVSRVRSVWLGFLYEISRGLSSVDIPIEHITKLIEEDNDAGEAL